MDSNTPEWAKHISAEMKAFLERTDRRHEQWRQEQRERDERDHKRQQDRDASLYGSLMKYVQASDAREKRYVEIANDTLRIQAELLALQKEILKLQRQTIGLQRETIGLQHETINLQHQTIKQGVVTHTLLRNILKQGEVTHALLRDILKTLRLGRNGHGRRPSRN